MAASFLRDRPELRQLVLPDVRLTGRSIGAGDYGSVEEVDILGVICAAREINDFFEDGSQIPEDEIRRASEQFVTECQMMSTIRHAKIVEFLGVCFFPEWRLPALVMERLQTNLYDVLDPETEGGEGPADSVNKPCIPLALKCSILQDVVEGLAFLHSRTPPIIHRDLTARNVLLTADMTAKIADLGVAPIVRALQRIGTMTKAPDASIYMPSGALEDESIYDVSIDIFSLGVLAIFTLSQTFPKPLSAVYMDDQMKVLRRTELERRGSYMHKIKRQLREEHPLILMIQNCLKDLSEDRPLIGQAIEFLSQARGEIQDEEGDMNRLELVQSIIGKTQEIISFGEQNPSATKRTSISLSEKNLEQVMKRADEVQPQSPSKSLLSPLQMWEQAFIEWEESTKTQQRSQKAHKAYHGVMEQMKAHLESSNGDPDRPASQLSAQAPTRVPVSESSNHSMMTPLPIKWTNASDMPCGVAYSHVVIINGMVYVKGRGFTSNDVVLEYNPGNGRWNELPTPRLKGSAMASLNGQLVLVGDCGKGAKKLSVWDSTRGGWAQPYPAMPSGRRDSATVGYQDYLIVACGHNRGEEDTVDVLDGSSHKWCSAQPVPMGGHLMSSVVIGDNWYISSYEWNDFRPHIFTANLPTLVSSPASTAASIWQKLPTPPVEGPTLLALQDRLLLVGGWGRLNDIYHYDPLGRRYSWCGHLPDRIHGSSCVLLPSGELIVAGGEVDFLNFSNEVYVGTIEC